MSSVASPRVSLSEPSLYSTVHCTLLYCTVLYCTVLYCTVLYCTVQSSFKVHEQPAESPDREEGYVQRPTRDGAAVGAGGRQADQDGLVPEERGHRSVQCASYKGLLIDQYCKTCTQYSTWTQGLQDHGDREV